MIVMAQKWFTKFAVQTSFVFSNIVPYLLEAVLSRVSCLIAALGICKGRTIKPAVGAGCVPEHGYALSRPKSLSWKLSKWNSVKFDPEYDC